MFFERGCGGPRRNEGFQPDGTWLERVDMMNGAAGTQQGSLELRPGVVGLALGYSV